MKMYRSMRYKHKMYSYKMFQHRYYLGTFSLLPNADATPFNLAIEPQNLMSGGENKWEQYRQIWQYFAVSKITYHFYPLQNYMYGTSSIPAPKIQMRRADGYRDFLETATAVGVTYDSVLLDPDTRLRVMQLDLGAQKSYPLKLPHNNLEDSTMFDTTGTSPTVGSNLLVNTPAKRKFRWMNIDDVTLAPREFSCAYVNGYVIASGQITTNSNTSVMDIYVTIDICYKGTRVGRAPIPPTNFSKVSTLPPGIGFQRRNAAPCVQSNISVSGTQATELE